MHELPPVDISVVIVNYGTADLCIDAVESVRARHHGGRRVDVHVVDNASPGNDAQTLREAHAARGWGAQVVLYLEDENHGFGRGNNLVLRRLAARPAPPDKVFLLNPDASLENETLDILAGVLDGAPRTAIAGCAIWRPHATEPSTAAFRFPNAVAEFTSALCIGILERPLARFSVPLGDRQRAREVDWVSGAGFMARMDVLEQMNFFQPDYFLYFEEVDLMHRIRAAGWAIHYAPDARIRHVAGAATGFDRAATTRKARPAYWYESWRLYFTRNRGSVYAVACVTLRLSGWMLNYMLRRLQMRQPDSPKGFVGDTLRYALLPILRPGKAPDGG